MKQNRLEESLEKVELSEKQKESSEPGDYEKALRVLDFLLQSDYAFYQQIREESTDEEFEEFCEEFPEAKIVLEKQQEEGQR